VHVILVAEAAEPLEGLGARLATDHGVETRALVADLGSVEGLARVERATSDLDVGLLVYNAAHSVVGDFVAVTAAEKLRMLDVNCRGPLVLCDHFARRLVARRRGGIILVSSLSGFQGHAMVGTYAATKAFDLVLAESLWAELAADGIDVLAFCPGATRTPNFLATEPRPTGFLSAPLMEPADAVAEALAALGRGPTAIAGRANRASAFVLHRLLPRRVLVRLMSRVTRAMYGGRPGPRA
jgi:hypothetical protein